ncbi:hypothetical protein [Flavobacterium undicola]|uniref:hypothetical protein n=1 Tax=Flavobacterium undicola TaxID=1932779 RepID=UPI0013764B00|nr:hypothetical protein [Flavobacterium undicola]MBA0884745.1 hypothetical protein [Flavobacterium undicola]
MKQFLKMIVLFLLLFFLVDKLFHWKIQALSNRELDKRLEWILEGKMNKAILIFGSSRAQHNLYSDAIQDSLKMPTFNLGYRGCTIDFQLFILKAVLKHNKKPEIIFLTIDDDREFLPEKTLQFRYDKLYNLVKYQEITNELIARKELSPFAVALYSARLGWEQFLKPNPITKYENWTATGTVLLDFKATDFDEKRMQNKKYNIKLELPERLTAFKEFQKICKAESIKLYVFIPPNFKIQNKEFENRLKSLIIDNKIELYSKKTSFFNNPQYFFDASHLNKKGAILYTNEIIKNVKAEL